MSKHVAKKLEKQRKREAREAATRKAAEGRPGGAARKRGAAAHGAESSRGGFGTRTHSGKRPHGANAQHGSTGRSANTASRRTDGGCPTQRRASGNPAHGKRGGRPQAAPRPRRASGICPIAHECGGCALIAQAYPVQLERKQAAMEKLFAPYAEQLGCVIDPIAGMEKPLGYRHKAATPFAPGKGGTVLAGFYAAGTHRIVPCASCPVEAAGAREILNGVARVAEELGIKAYNEDTHRGLLRHAVLRLGWRTREGMLTLVTNGQELPRERELAERLQALSPRITCLAHNVNQRPGNAILGAETRILAGASRMRDKLLSCTFEISPTAFYQTNPAQTEVLYSLAIAGAELCDGDTVVDAYCGSGTIGICAAAAAREAGGRIRLVGVERTPEAIEDAKRNAELNDVAQDAAFIDEDATSAMQRAARDGKRADVVIMDPPRAGATPAFLQSAAALEPRRIIYVSCNPQTQVRDFYLLAGHGYRPARVTPVDMFPHTEHVETVAVLERA